VVGVSPFSHVIHTRYRCSAREVCSNFVQSWPAMMRRVSKTGVAQLREGQLQP
jgi:hypothetical protein